MKQATINLNCLKVSDKLKDALSNYQERYAEEISSVDMPTINNIVMSGIDIKDDMSGYDFEDDAALVRIIQSNSEKDRALLDCLLICVCGWSTETLLKVAPAEALLISEYIEHEIEMDDECPYDQTERFFNYLTVFAGSPPENAEKQMDVANAFFNELCGLNPDELAIRVLSAIAKREDVSMAQEASALANN
jgi:hypothetical protein